MANPWEMNWGAPQPRGPILGPPPKRDPYRERDQQLQEQGAGRDETRTGIAVRNEGRDVSNTAFNQKDKLRSDYEMLAPVKEYRASLNALASALETSENATGDNALIYAYAKIMDPASVVRESEMAMAGSGDSTVNALAAKIGKELGIDGGGQLSPEVRKRLRNEAINSVKQRVQIYDQQRDRFTELAKRNNFDPYEIVGDHDAKPFVEKFKEYDIGNRGGKARRPEMVGGFAVGTDVTFNGGQEGAFDRDKYLETRGIDSQQESNIMSFLNSNRGNEGFSIEDLNTYYDGIGARRLSPDAAAEMVAAAKKGYQFAPVDTATAEREYMNSVGLTDDVRAEIDANRDTTVQGNADAIVRGVADTSTLGFSDEIAAAGDTIFSGGTMESNLARQRYIDRQDERVNPYARLSGQIAGGFALPGANVTGAGRLAGVGAAYGGGYGFGSGEGSITDRLVSAGKGAAIGGFTGAALDGIANRIAGGGGPNSGGGGRADVMAAAQRQGIDMLPADVGGPVVQRLTAGMAQTPFGGAPILNRAQSVSDGVGARLASIAQSEGAPLRQEVFGDTVKAAAEGYAQRSGATGGRMYDDARALAGDTRLQAPAARRNLDAQIAELSETASTSAPLIAGLERLAADIPQGKKLSVDAIRRLRTNVRSEAQSEGLRATDYQRRAGLVLDDLAQDIEGQLSPEAAKAFREADDFWKQRLNNIDDVVAEVIGPQGDRSSEKVAQRLVSMGRADSARLRTFVNTLNPEEAGIVRGSLISEMGRATSSSQGAEGANFSLETFLTNWDKLPTRTRDMLFKGESKAAIEDLAKIAEGARSSKRFANTSNTAGASGVGGYISGGLSISTLGASIPIEMVTGRLLASPRFARLLASKVDKGMAVKRLGRIAAREPALAPDIQPILNALGQSPGRLAAEDQERN